MSLPNDYKELLSKAIKKCFIVFGPDMTVQRIKGVQGLSIRNDGTITAMTGDPKILSEAFLNQFKDISPLIFKQLAALLLLDKVVAEDPAKTPYSQMTQPAQLQPAG